MLLIAVSSPSLRKFYPAMPLHDVMNFGEVKYHLTRSLALSGAICKGVALCMQVEQLQTEMVTLTAEKDAVVADQAALVTRMTDAMGIKQQRRCLCASLV
jgi:hypothetical protein